jgi:SAM-dependent methyltransferase
VAIEDVQKRYDTDAQAYVTWWAPVLRRNMEPVLESLDWSGVRTFLEVGCGTGGVLEGAAARVPVALVVGVDATSAMLRHAPREHARVQADAHRLPLADASVDVAVCGFVLQHTERPDVVLRELGRVVRPGGQLRIAAWGGPILRWEGEQIFSEQLDVLGVPAAPPSVQPGRAATDSVDKLHTLAEEAGFDSDVVQTSLDWRPDVDEVFGQLSAMRGTGRRFAALTPSQARTVENRVRGRLDNVEISRWAPYEVLILSGKRVNLRHR